MDSNLSPKYSELNLWNFKKNLCIIDGSEVFIETCTFRPTCTSSLQLVVSISTIIQLDFWLHACTPNGAIFYISLVYVGSISDVELTQLNGFLGSCERKSRHFSNG